MSLCIFSHWSYEGTCWLRDDDLDFVNRTVVVREETQRHLDGDGLGCCHDSAYTVQGYHWHLGRHRWSWNKTEYRDDVWGFFFTHLQESMLALKHNEENTGVSLLLKDTQNIDRNLIYESEIIYIKLCWLSRCSTTNLGGADHLESNIWNSKQFSTFYWHTESNFWSGPKSCSIHCSYL